MKSVDPSLLLTFGKYRNRTVEEVISIDLGWVVWCAENVTSQPHGITSEQVGRAYKKLRERGGPWPRRVRAPTDHWPDYHGHFDRQYTEGREPVYYADGSGYLPAEGPCGPLYFDRNGNT